MVFTAQFRAAFKEAAFGRRKQLARDLATVFDLPETHPMWGETRPFWGEVKELPDGHPYRAELVRRHGQMPSLEAQPLLQFDASTAKQVLSDALAETSFSLYDYDAPYLGGYQCVKWRAGDFYPKVPPDNARLTESWAIEPLVRAYWNDASNEARYRRVSDFALYADREAKSARERAHHSLGFGLLNVAEALAYQERLITLNYPEYTLRTASERWTQRRRARSERRPRGGPLAQSSRASSTRASTVMCLCRYLRAFSMYDAISPALP
jgi:hypothetical protein